MIAMSEEPKVLIKFEQDGLSRIVEETHVKEGQSAIYHF